MNWQENITVLSSSLLTRRYIPVSLKELAWRFLVFTARCRRSNPLSFALRPVFTHKRLHVSVGLLIVLIATVAALVSPFYSFAGENTGGPIALNVLPEGEISISTNQSVVLPVKNFTVSQGYRAFHPGLDLAARKGEPINPVMAGTVTVVQKDRFGYGQHVIVQHTNNYQSLYAHMSQIDVTPGQTVTNTTVIGAVGSTGRSTGPHLHLEIYDDAHRALNPKTFLGIK
jgi:murein DD-endopeptidase MepM/ murein hydrolase activator NlpD